MPEIFNDSATLNELYIRKVGKRAQVTIPKKIVEHLHIDEGDQVRVGMLNDCIIIEPVKVVPKGALYYKYGSEIEFITLKDLKEAVAEANSDYKKGKLKSYRDATEMLEDIGCPVED